MDGLSGAVEGYDDREADCDFRSGYGDDEENEHLTVVVRQAVRGRVKTRKGNECEVCGAKHELETHEDDDDVPTHDHTCEADGEEEAGDEEVVVESSHEK